VQADRTATINAVLPVGQVGTVVEVQAEPLMNAVDTTNGYVMDDQQIQEVPLPTGSFTGLAILSPGVNAELPGGTGVNSGLGNQPIWANGQRDTSNSFLLNGVDASNLFNGKSTSQVASARIVNNTGVANPNSTTAAPVQSTASVYLAVGQALPTPAPETVQELRVNTSMYDAQQGATSGAHIDMSTTSGTNAIHGQLYLHRGTDWLNAAPFFNKEDPNIPSYDKNPELHRYTAGGTVGGPIIKNKLFAFISYQHIHDSDQDIGLSRLIVPEGLTDDRSVTALETISDTYWGTSLVQAGPSAVSPTAVALLQYKLPNGQYLIPSWDGQHFSGERDQPRHRLLHFRSSGRESRLEQEHQGHGIGKILLPARSEHRSLRLLQCSRLSSASRCRQPGRVDYQYADAQVEPERNGSARNSSREGLQHHRAAVHAAIIRRANRDGSDQHLRI